MYVEDGERAAGISIGDLDLLCRPVIVYAVDERDVLPHLLADLCHIGVVGALLFPERCVDRAAILGERIHGRIVERREVEEHKVTGASLVQGIELLINAIDVIDEGKAQSIVGEERRGPKIIGSDPYSA